MATFDLNRGALAPVADEVDIIDVSVTGNIPRDLNGLLLRNGPNPLSGQFTGSDLLSWWPESAMLHGISFEDGHVKCYKNRWVRTKRWANVFAPHEVPTVLDTNPNVNVLMHAGELLVLAEGGAPVATDANLSYFGTTQRHAALGGGMTAHPKVDPRTGELMAFRADWNAPWLRYGVYDSRGTLRVDMTIDVPAPAMMHDMAITNIHSILLDLNVAYDFAMLSQGHRIPIRWFDDRRARLGVVARHGGPMRWFEVEPCFIQHVVNAYDKDETVIALDAVRYPWFLRLSQHPGQFEDNPLGQLWRYEIDLRAGTVSETQLSDLGVELPRINEAHTGSDYRYLYAAEQPSNTQMRGIVRYDLQQRAKVTRFNVSEGDQNSEPVFVAARSAASSAEGDGWVLAWVYRGNMDTSDLVILDAGNIDRDPVATIHLPRRVPAGFHGTWVPSAT